METQTEQEKILNLLFEGYNKKQTAELLNISIYKLNKILEEYLKE
jgi:DNA-binding NarL/FixJ family response regulator